MGFQSWMPVEIKSIKDAVWPKDMKAEFSYASHVSQDKAVKAAQAIRQKFQDRTVAVVPSYLYEDWLNKRHDIRDGVIPANGMDWHNFNFEPFIQK